MNENKKTLLVLGAGGMLGSEFLNRADMPGWSVVRHGRVFHEGQRADLRDAHEVSAMLDAMLPDAILNLAGLTNVERCESFPNEAYLGNVKTLENVAEWIKRAAKPVRLVHISTDQVYDGAGPHSEGNVSLKNYYAFSKYAGELVAAQVGGVVLRTNFFGKSKCASRQSLSDWLFSSLEESKKIHVFEDVMFSPLSMATLTDMITAVILSETKGVYNLGSREGLSKADFAYHFAKTLGLNDQLMTRGSADNASQLKAYRPKDMRLDVARFEEAMNIVLPSLVDEIKKAAEEYKNET